MNNLADNIDAIANAIDVETECLIYAHDQLTNTESIDGYTDNLHALAEEIRSNDWIKIEDGCEMPDDISSALISATFGEHELQIEAEHIRGYWLTKIDGEEVLPDYWKPLDLPPHL